MSDWSSDVCSSDLLVFGYVDKAKVEEIIDKYIRKGILVDGIIPVTYTTVKPE